MINNKIKEKSNEVVKLLTSRGLKITSAESCTGGLFAASITSISGSSECFEGSFVTYSNDIKHKIINVSEETLKKYGAVSEECVLEMSENSRNCGKNSQKNCGRNNYESSKSVNSAGQNSKNSQRQGQNSRSVYGEEE